jgi:cell volume regulation protein A
MELVTIHDTDYELIEVFIDNEIYKGECRISDMKLPAGITITMINRNNIILAPRGSTNVFPGDILSILVSQKNIEKVTLQVLNCFAKI